MSTMITCPWSSPTLEFSVSGRKILQKLSSSDKKSELILTDKVLDMQRTLDLLILTLLSSAFRCFLRIPTLLENTRLSCPLCAPDQYSMQEPRKSCRSWIYRTTQHLWMGGRRLSSCVKELLEMISKLDFLIRILEVTGKNGG